MAGKDEGDFTSPAEKVKRELRKPTPKKAELERMKATGERLVTEALKENPSAQVSGSATSSSPSSFPYSTAFPISPEQLASGAAQSAPASEASHSEEAAPRSKAKTSSKGPARKSAPATSQPRKAAAKARRGTNGQGETPQGTSESAQISEVAFFPLKIGDMSGVTGGRVQQLQIALGILVGLKSQRDGVFDRNTETALKAFQTQQGLAATGVFDSLTAQRLEAAMHEVMAGGTYKGSPQAGPTTFAAAYALTNSSVAKDCIAAAGTFMTASSPALNATMLLKGVLASGLTYQKTRKTAPRWLVNWLQERGQTGPLAVWTNERGTLYDDNTPLTAEAAAILALAVDLSRRTTGRESFDARHLVFTLLTPVASPTPLPHLAEFKKQFGLDATDFLTLLVEQSIARPEPRENIEVWRDELAAALAAAKDAQEATRPRRILPGFTSDRPMTEGKDALGIMPDVDALAGVICLEEARPPLSIGLFGDWGSGKSFFMEKMQARIAEIAKAEKTRRKDVKDGNTTLSEPGAPRFVCDVVQVRFNAWHYADANLWASLTAEFFDQLRRGGYEGGQASDYKALIGKVAERVKSLESGAVKAQDALDDATRAARDAEEALKTAREKRDASSWALASEQLGKQFDAIVGDKDNAAKLKEVGRRVYRDDLGKDIVILKDAAVEAVGLRGKIKLVARVLAGGGIKDWTTWLAFAAIVLLAVAGIAWQLGDAGDLAVLVQRIIGGSGTLAGLAAVWQSYKIAKPVLDGAFAYAKAVETARKELAKEVETREVAARDATRKLDTARTALDTAKKPLNNYGDDNREAPGTILRYFLFEDSDVRDYDKQVGIVSRARRSFAQLDAIAATARKAHLAEEKQKSGLTPNADEAAALERFEKMEADVRKHVEPDGDADAGKGPEASKLTVPDRIVLYIDDLDRCTHEQVYAVLQAIHLLLAFELFVVVVGVDVEWVTDAVARQFANDSNPLSLAAATDETREKLRKEEDDKRRARAVNYLEKIFQVPFWLQKLTIKNAAASGGTYGDYIRGLLDGNTPLPQSPAIAKGEAAPQMQSPEPDECEADIAVTTDDAAQPETNIFMSVDTAEAPAPSGTGAPTAPIAGAPALREGDASLASLRLTQAEIDFLASPEIGAIAAKSPRAVKRLVNVYRIVRGRLSPEELRSFLGEDGTTPQWPVAIFLAAVEVGQSVEVADLLYATMKEPYMQQLEGSMFNIIFNKAYNLYRDQLNIEGYIPSESEENFNKIARKLYEVTQNEKTHNLCDTGMIIAQSSNESIMNSFCKLTSADVVQIARIVRRYSFNRYH